MNASPFVNHLNAPFGVQHFSYVPSFGILGTAPSADLVDALTARRARVSVSGPSESTAAAVELLNYADVAVIHLDDAAADLMAGLRVPSIVVADRSVKRVTAQMRSALKLAAEVVAPSEDVRQLLTADRPDVTVIAPGPDMATAYIRLAQGLVAGQRAVT